MKQLESILKTILIFVVCWGLVTACNKQQEKYGGQTFITSLGDPPVEFIIWSPVDQNQILVTASEIGQGRAEIYILDLSTNKKDVLAQTENGDMWAETWLPDGKKILIFVSPDTVEFEKGGYWLIDTSNHSLEFFGESGRQIWSPNGRMIATYIVDQKPGTNFREVKLHLLDIRTNTDEIIYEDAGTQMLFGFSWSPDSENLVYSVGDYTSSNLYVVNIKTKALTKITFDGSNDVPVWSPSRNIIAYAKVHNGLAPSIHLVRPDGSCDIKLSTLGDARSPTWSPDGGKLAFVTSDGIYYLEVDKIFSENGYQTMCT